MRQIFRKLHDERGQALVEFAFVLPLLMLLLFGIIDFGLAMNTANNDENIANYAVREAAVIGTNTSASCNGTLYYTLWQWSDCELGESGDGIPNVCIYDPSGGSTWTLGDAIEVQVTSQFSWLALITNGDGNLGKISPGSTIRSSAEMRLEDSISSSSTSGPVSGNPFLVNPSSTAANNPCPTSPA